MFYLGHNIVIRCVTLSLSLCVFGSHGMCVRDRLESGAE